MKKIKEVFKEAETEKENEVKSSTVVMELDDFIEEHKNLIKILRSGDKKALEAEASKQEKELRDEVGDDYEEEEED